MNNQDEDFHIVCNSIYNNGFHKLSSHSLMLDTSFGLFLEHKQNQSIESLLFDTSYYNFFDELMNK